MIEKVVALMPQAISAALCGGAEILQRYSQNVAVDFKEDKSPLTEADLAAHERINGMLVETGLPVLSEESAHAPYEERSSWELFWLVDPLDGTKEFINRNGEFTVNVALIHQGAPIAGVVYLPALSELYFGVVTRGAFKMSATPQDNESLETLDFEALIGRADSLSDGTTIERPYTIIGSRSHGSPEYEAFVGKLREQHPDAETLSAGSSLKFCRVAEGAADVYPRLGRTMEWDTGAGHAIVKASGRSVRVFEETEELQYNKADLANPWFIVE